MLLATPGAAHAACARLPAVFRDGRAFVKYALPGNRSLDLLTDTGGGGSIVAAEAAHRAGVEGHAAPPEVAAEVGDAQVATPPVLPTGSTLPPIPAPLLIVPTFPPMKGWSAEGDGLLGQSWFAGHVVTWDYAAGTLSLGCTPAGRPLEVQLPSADAGQGSQQFPRVVVEVAGEPLPVLFDTGATTMLTPAALAAVGGGGAMRATSMVTASRVARWRERHPEWRVVEAAQVGTGSRMIEVPEVSIAGIPVGPVWFTERPDAAFVTWMSGMMVAPVEGAIGGNAFRDLRITLDYPQHRAWVERARDRGGPEHR